MLQNNRGEIAIQLGKADVEPDISSGLSNYTLPGLRPPTPFKPKSMGWRSINLTGSQNPES
jgi:hypothetical protein